MRYRNSFSLQRGMKLTDLHPHQNQGEITGWEQWAGSAIAEELSYRIRTWKVELCGQECVAGILPLVRHIFFPVGILLVTQILCSTGQKAGYSLKNSCLLPFINFFPLKSGSTHAMLAGFFSFHLFYSIGEGSCLYQAYSINLQFIEI